MALSLLITFVSSACAAYFITRLLEIRPKRLAWIVISLCMFCFSLHVSAFVRLFLDHAVSLPFQFDRASLPPLSTHVHQPVYHGWLVWTAPAVSLILATFLGL